MTPVFTSYTTKKLVLHYVTENINIRKSATDLLKLIAIGQQEKVWKQVLNLYVEADTKMNKMKIFSKN